MGIRYVVVPERLAPKPFATEEFPLDPAVRDALSSQLDLVQINVNPAVTIYENAAWIPTRATLPSSDAGDIGSEAVEPRDALAAATATDFGDATAALGDERGPTTFRGPVDGEGELYLASGPSSGWHLEVEGEEAERRTVFGWANAFDLPQRGHGDAPLRHPGHPVPADRPAGRALDPRALPRAPPRRVDAADGAGLVKLSRWPAVVILVGLVVAAWVVDRDHEREQPEQVEQEATPLEAQGLMPVAPPEDALSSTWYCGGRDGRRRTVGPTPRSSWPTPPTGS